MALTSVPPVKLELPSTPIQELIKSNTTNQIPQRYVVSDSTLESNGCVLPWMNTIIIDFQLLLDFSSPCGKQELLKLRDALSSWGCFQQVLTTLSREFAMKDLGKLHHFLGITVSRSKTGLFLSQGQYAKSILARASMTGCNPTATPVDTSAKLSATDGPKVADPALYRSIAGALQYLTITRPDISYAVQQICLFMHDPREPHLHFMKRVLRYIKGTLEFGFTFSVSKSHALTAYTDADWADCPNSRRSTSGYCVFLGDNLISWSSKRQATVSKSSAEAEYRGVANVVAETTWLRNLLLELHMPLRTASLVYCDNISAVYLSGNPVQHQRTKHIEIDIHFVREQVQLGRVRVLHVPSPFQYADIFTKGLPRQLFSHFRSSLSGHPPPASTAGVY